MKNSEPFNIIVSGVGGQGVLTLSKVFWRMCEVRGLQVQGSVYKGGAQQLGTIHAVIRIFTQHNPEAHLYSPQIVEGDLDLLLGLEPWETLRYVKYFSDKTHVLTNTQSISIETQRYQARTYEDPMHQLKKLKIRLSYCDFSLEAIQLYGTKKMVNYLLVEKAIIDRLIPFTINELKEAYRAVRGITESTQTKESKETTLFKTVNNDNKEGLNVEASIKLER